jgi:hypothetical protein
MGFSRLWPVLAVSLGATLTACSGGSSSPKVANLGASTTTVALTGNGSSGAASLAQAEAYATCMRSHGVTDFPDPTPAPGGGVGFRFGLSAKAGSSANGPDLQSPQFVSAQNACKSLLPNGGVGRPLSPAAQQQFLNWAACIRAHGVPNFPDPVFSGGGVEIRTPNGGLQMQAAQEACKSKMPAGFGTQSG